MNLKSVKERLVSLQNQGQKKEKVDYKKFFWKPTVEGKYVIRIIPSKFDSENPFREVFIHYGFTKYPLYSLSNWGEKDPIEDFAKKLQKQGDKESYIQGKKLEPKMRVMVPIIVRGEEDLGVRLWDINKDTYLSLLTFADDEDYGDFTDITDGRDLTVVYSHEKIGNNSYLMPTRISPKVKSTPITEDGNKLNLWLTEQPDILEIQSKKTFDEMKEILRDFITKSEDNEIDEEEESTTSQTAKSFALKGTPTKSQVQEEEEDEEDNTSSIDIIPVPVVKKEKSSKPVTSKSNKFNDLFDEDEDDDDFLK